jgi:hypothetical protein
LHAGVIILRKLISVNLGIIKEIMLKRIGITIIYIMLPAVILAGDALITENFADLSKWKEVYFPEISARTSYNAAADGKETFLKAQSHASASSIIYREPFNPYEYPLLRWRWKVDNVIKGADLKTKETDDSPIRIYVVFEYNPKKSSAAERALYGSIKLLYGEYPPHSSLNYTWASEPTAPDIITSSYTDRSKMIILEKGSRKAGIWVEENVNIIADYRRAFGMNPPEKAMLGIMNDSENMKGSAVSYVTGIVLSR